MSFWSGPEAKLVDDPVYCGPVTAILSAFKFGFQLRD
jgi:hypothetical protein